MNAKTNMAKLEKLYDKLSDAERFRLALEAYAAGDRGTVQALTDSAPRKVYRTTWPFSGQLDAIQEIAWATVTEAIASGCLMVLAWSVLLQRESQAEPDEAAIERDYELLTVEAGRVLLAWAALRAFCDDLGIEVEQALAHAPAVSIAEMCREFAELWTAEADRPSLEEARAAALTLHAIWSHEAGELCPGLDADQVRQVEEITAARIS